MKVENLSEKQKYQLIYSRVMLLDRGITVVDISLNLSDFLSLADRLLMIEHDGTVREIPKENFAFVPRNVPWETFYRVGTLL